MNAMSGRKSTQILAGFVVGLSAVVAVALLVSFLSQTGTVPTDAENDVTAARDADKDASNVETPPTDESSGNALDSETEIATPQDDTAASSVDGASSEQVTPNELTDAPELSIFRLEPDGQMLVAGRSTPGWETNIHLDDDVLATFLPDANGEFVQFVTVEPDTNARVLSLSARSPETGHHVVSNAEIIIAPFDGPREPELPEAEDAVDSTVYPQFEDDAVTTQDMNLPDPSEEDSAALSEPSPEAGQDRKEQGAAAESPAPDPTVLISDADGVRVLQAPVGDEPPDVMSVVALDTISYSQSGAVELSGRAAGEGFVRVYIDNAPVMASPVDADGNWRSTLPELDTGVYTLRIDEVDKGGAVTSRVETPFKREDQQVLEQATDPSLAVQAVTVQPGFTLWGISRERYGDGFAYVRIFEANRGLIRDPDLIYPGQVFALPQ